jgi:hypothetical protein
MPIRISPSSTTSMSRRALPVSKQQQATAINACLYHHGTSSSSRSFSVTPMRTPVRRHSSGQHGQQPRRPSFLRPLSTVTAAAAAPPLNASKPQLSTCKVNTAESVHKALASSRRALSTTNANKIEQSHPVEAEGDMATTQDHVVIDVSEQFWTMNERAFRGSSWIIYNTY